MACIFTAYAEGGRNHQQAQDGYDGGDGKNSSLIEFKVDLAKETAIKQIKDKDHAEKYHASGKDIILISISFSSEEKKCNGIYLGTGACDIMADNDLQYRITKLFKILRFLYDLRKLA